MLASPLAAEAQPAGKVARIGLLTTGVVALTVPLVEGLRDHGYVEGQSISIERRAADGQLERLPHLATELVRLKVDLIAEVRAGQDARSAALRAPRRGESVVVSGVTAGALES
jgi:putative ABC transport system substrate-binding protein